MSQKNVEIVRRFMRRFVEQEVEAALQDVDPEAELDWSNSDAPDSGRYKGHAGWRAFVQARDAALVRRGFELAEMTAPKPEQVLVVGRMSERGRASGVEVASQGAAVFTLREGKIVRIKVYQTSDQAHQALGLNG